MLGCDLHCSYCQNWVTSQALRDTKAVAPLRPITAQQLVELANRERARLVVSSYNEPLITAEWAVSVFRQAHQSGLACAFVSNGNATPEVLDYLRPWLCAYKIDLKTFSDPTYRGLGGTLENITRTIQMVHERGLWLEVVTLVIPGLNDSEDELRQAARFLASVSRDIPWHVTAFHKDYRMTDPEDTPAATLIRAAEIGTEEGLRFVYAGNLPGRRGTMGEHPLPFMRCDGHRAPWLSHTLLQPRPRWSMPQVPSACAGRLAKHAGRCANRQRSGGLLEPLAASGGNDSYRTGSLANAHDGAKRTNRGGDGSAGPCQRGGPSGAVCRRAA